MPPEPFEEDFKRLGDLLVERGFAQSYHYNSITKVGSFQWTVAGARLKLYLSRLLPDLQQATPADIVTLVTVIMFSDPSGPLVKIASA